MFELAIVAYLGVAVWFLWVNRDELTDPAVVFPCLLWPISIVAVLYVVANGKLDE